MSLVAIFKQDADRDGSEPVGQLVIGDRETPYDTRVIQGVTLMDASHIADECGADLERD